MNKMDTEVIATAAFKLAISKTDLLSPFVNEKDKEPSWCYGPQKLDNKITK